MSVVDPEPVEAVEEIVPQAQRVMPWRRLGTDISEAKTVKEALQAAGTDWTVRKEPLYYTVPSKLAEDQAEVFDIGNKQVMIPVPNRYGIVRETDMELLGIVGPGYSPFQNEQAFQFAYDLIDTGECVPDTMGVLRGGKWVYLNLRLPGKDILIKGKDAVGLNLGLATSHDGSKAITAFVNTVRIICENTLALAIASARTTWSVRHVGELQGRLEEARRSLELTFAYADEFGKLGNQLASQPFTEEQFHGLADTLIPKQPRVNEALKELWATTTTLDAKLKSTRWGALNVVAEFYDWGKEGRDPHAQVMSSWVGAGNRARNKALTILQEV